MAVQYPSRRSARQNSGTPSPPNSKMRTTPLASSDSSCGLAAAVVGEKGFAAGSALAGAEVGEAGGAGCAHAATQSTNPTNRDPQESSPTHEVSRQDRIQPATLIRVRVCKRVRRVHALAQGTQA